MRRRPRTSLLLLVLVVAIVGVDGREPPSTAPQMRKLLSVPTLMPSMPRPVTPAPTPDGCGPLARLEGADCVGELTCGSLVRLGLGRSVSDRRVRRPRSGSEEHPFFSRGCSRVSCCARAARARCPGGARCRSDRAPPGAGSRGGACRAQVNGSTSGSTNVFGNEAPDRLYAFSIGAAAPLADDEAASTTPAPTVGFEVFFSSCGSSYDTWLRVLKRVPASAGEAWHEVVDCDDCGFCDTSAVLSPFLVEAGADYLVLIEVPSRNDVAQRISHLNH